MKKFKNPIILETACGHDGKERNLKMLTDLAISVKGKIIKYQIFNLDERSIENTKERKIFKNLVLDEKTWERTITYSKKKKLISFADVYGNYSFNLAEKNGIHGYKIHSEDFFNSYFIEKVIKTKKPVIINLGGTHKSEVYNLLNFLNRKKLLSEKIFLMHGVQTFPTPVDGHSLYEFKNLINNYKSYGVNFAYSDHIEQNDPMSFSIPMIAYSLGAKLIEKHFTDNINLKRTDYHSALDKDKLIKFIKSFKNLDKILNKNTSHLKYEKKYRNMFKKSCVASKKLKKKENIKMEDLEFKKNKSRGSYFFSHEINGKKLVSDIESGSSILKSKIVQNVGAIITVRTSSSRYPNKALKKINGVESIKLVIRRAKKLKNISQIILATSKNKSDDIFTHIAKDENINLFRGSLNDVANRYYECAKKFKLDYIVRITGDAILFDEISLDKLIINHLNKNVDVSFIKGLPYGTAKEVISLILKIINDKACKKKYGIFRIFLRK